MSIDSSNIESEVNPSTAIIKGGVKKLGESIRESISEVPAGATKNLKMSDFSCLGFVSHSKELFVFDNQI